MSLGESVGLLSSFLSLLADLLVGVAPTSGISSDLLMSTVDLGLTFSDLPLSLTFVFCGLSVDPASLLLLGSGWLFFEPVAPTSGISSVSDAIIR